MNHFLLVFIAVLPAIALMIYIYLQDNHEKEPIGLLMAIFGLGILSCLPTMLFEWLFSYMLDALIGGLSTNLYWFIYAMIGVAIVEEFFKFLAAYLLTWRNRHFNYKFDGIVYCLFASMGFAATENIMYLVVENMTTGDSQDVLNLGIQRGLFAIPLHAMCAIFMGYFYGNAKYAKSYGNRSKCRQNILLGLLIASLLHGFYDFCLFTGNPTLYYVFLAFVILADIATIVHIHFAKKNNQQMYIAPEYQNYWIGPAANPYQPFGGQQAPVYGGYNFGGSTGDISQPQFSPAMQAAPQTRYMPQSPTGGQQRYMPQATAGMQQQYTPLGQAGIQQQYMSQTPTGSQQQYAPQSPATAQSPYTPQTTADSQYGTTPAQVDSQFAPLLQFSDPNVSQGTGTTEVPQQSAGSKATGTDIYGRPQTAIIPPQNFRNQMVRCPNCGCANRFNAFYCSECGSSLHQF